MNKVVYYKQKTSITCRNNAFILMEETIISSEKLKITRFGAPGKKLSNKLEL